MRKNVFLMGLDDFNRKKLASLYDVERYAFHGLLANEEVVKTESYPIEEMLGKAENLLSTFPGTVDGIAGFNDFPVSEMVTYLCEELGLPTASLHSVIACEHKYWCRKMAQEAVPEVVPAFAEVDPFADDVRGQIPFDYPFWLKPVKSHSSYLGFKIESDEELERAIRITRKNIGRIAAPFNHMFERVDPPSDLREVNGYHCIVEEIISGGKQCTVEGYVWQGEVTCYGIIDSITYPNVSSFARYQYPSKLPAGVQDRIAEVAERVIRAVNLDNSPFNIEFFYNEEEDQLWLLEVNPRISESHADLFEKVDGVSHHQIMVQLALGERPVFPKGEGNYGCAAKLFVRHFEDGLVLRTPGADDIRRVEQRFPDTLVKIEAEEGKWLSDMIDQDSYSYEVAVLFMGAENEEALMERYYEALELMPIETSPSGRGESASASGATRHP